MDREKVIKTLEYCVLSYDCRPCEYWMEFDDTGCQIMKDALALLKEQKEQINNRDESLEKAREEIKWLRGMLKEQEATMVIESENMYTGLPITHCPKCGVTLDRFLYGRQHEGQINYCPMCGQAVKWG